LSSENISQGIEGQAQRIFQDGLALLQQGNIEAADALFAQAHQLNSNNVDALNLLGIRSYQKNDHQKALAFLNQANLLYPNSAQTLSNLGLTHTALLEFREALHFFDLAIESNSNIPEVHNNRGNALKGLGRNGEATKAYANALALRPNYAEAISNKGVILLEDGNPEKAVPLFEQALQINPNLAVALNSLGNALSQLGRDEESFACFERALQLNESYLDACLNFGNALKKAKKYKPAIECFQHALKINPENAKTFYSMGEAYYDIGDSALAKTYYAKSLDLNANDLEAQYALAIAQIPKVCKSQDEMSESRKSFSKRVEFLETTPHLENNPVIASALIARHPFYLAYQDEDNEPLLSRYGLVCVRQAKIIQESLNKDKQIAKENRKNRIGIVSNYFYNHPVWHAITKGWVMHLDPTLFEIHIFNTNGTEDAETELAKLNATTYLNCGHRVQQAAQIIADRDLDVLLYPEIGMDTTTKALACLRLAPIQVVSWGHPETTGLPTIDYYLSGQFLEPEGAKLNYCEELVELPNLGTYFLHQEIQATDIDLESLELDPNSPIFICAGSPTKYTPVHDQVFVEIAKRLGDCQFIFFMFDEHTFTIVMDRLHQSFKSAGLDPDKFIHYAPFLKKEAFFGLMQKADLYLDTIGFSGFNTAMQALECHLPVVTIEGNRLRGRLASAILHKMGLPELICKTEASYIDLVVKLIQNPELLSSYKAAIAKSKMHLFNDLEPIMALEKFLINKTKKSPTRI
jgi:predicted O-linked N-acetylglucosamine transferase (SPINDLY family)